MLTVYGIKSCDTCRKARKFLAENDIEFRFHDVRDDGLDIQMLERWADRLDWEKLLNRKSLTWRKIPETDREGMTKDRAFALMLDQPTLVKRPVLESARFMAVGFSEKRFGEYWTKASSYYRSADPACDVVLGQLVLGIRENAVRIVNLDQQSKMKIGNALRDSRGLLHGVRNDHDRIVFAQLVHEVFDTCRGDGVESRARLVHQDHFGVDCDRAGNTETLLLTA